MSYGEREKLRVMIQDLKNAGIVVDSTSDFASPILIVKKKTGDERICIDYRALNKITKKMTHPLPLIDDQLDRLAGNEYFTTLDMASGYYQIPMDKQSQRKTAFNCRGRYHESGRGFKSDQKSEAKIEYEEVLLFTKRNRIPWVQNFENGGETRKKETKWSTKRTREFKWANEQHAVFEKLKNELVSTKVLALFVADAYTEVHTDISSGMDNG
ncbi:uncharacterized protein LOC113371390 [Ctenocephalides felis]|uniref:uncharacterized protein LOC113371390 n=1 Tax=Ctenocephalides felis TaxID=7515 RepID=UPI000E6E1290|nr:uncharacterized protein LOC113371390 [Ctenocephalides felis]